MVGQVHAGSGVPVAHQMLVTGGVGVGLGLEPRYQVAPAARCCGEYRCAVAVLRGVGERRGDRGQRDGAVVAQWCGQPVEAVGVEERGIGGAVEERRVPQHVDQQVAVGAHAVDAGSG